MFDATSTVPENRSFAIIMHSIESIGEFNMSSPSNPIGPIAQILLKLKLSV